jgi:hypothetical protein
MTIWQRSMRKMWTDKTNTFSLSLPHVSPSLFLFRCFKERGIEKGSNNVTEMGERERERGSIEKNVNNRCHECEHEKMTNRQ